MSEKRTCQEVKIEISKDDEERIRNCIHIYCTVGANRIKELLARIGGKKNNNDTKVNSVSERMERIKEAAPEIYELLEYFTELCELLEDFTLTCACASCTCDDREKARREARNLFARIYGGENDGE